MSRLHIAIFGSLLLTPLLISSAHAATATNASELRDLLRGTAQPAELHDIPLDSGCGPAGCVTDIEQLTLQRDTGTLQHADGTALHWQEQPGLPDIDWLSVAAYAVNSAGQRWGTCLEFAHSGIGKSGVYQRWSSVVLVPYLKGKPGANAYRLVGYWTGCDSLQSGAQPGQLRFPIVVHAEQLLQVQHYACDVKGCEVEQSPTPIKGSASSETGALQLP